MTVLASPFATSRRDRVVSRFVAASRYPVTLVLAAAGWGKTVALRHYLSTIEAPVVRFDVRPEHGTLSAFARGLVNALGDIGPNAGAGVADAVTSALATSAPGTALSDWIAGVIAEFDGTIVLDDFHHAEAGEYCAQLLTALIDRTKQRVRWVVVARSTQHLPVSSWLVYGDIGVPINEADLRLTAVEALEAAKAEHADSDESDVERLLAATGGWLTAFDLALRAPEYPVDVRRAAESAKVLSYDYLAEQVYGALSERDRSTLLLASTLPDIDADVLEHAGVERARSLLAELQRRVTFLSVAAEDSRQASPRRYQCHDLFRAFLERELDLQGEPSANETRRRAARALCDAGRTLQALPLFIRAHAWNDAVELLQTHGFDWHGLGHADTIAAAVAALAQTALADHPATIAFLGLKEAGGGRYDRAIPLYERAIALTQDAEFAATLTSRLGLATLNAGRNPSAMLEGALESGKLNSTLRGEILSTMAMAYGRFEQFDRLTTPILDEAARLARATDQPMKRAVILHRLGVASHMHGDVARAAAAFGAAAELAIEGYRFRMAATIYANWADNLSLNGDDIAGAERATALAFDAAERSGDRYIRRYVSKNRMQLAILRGDAALMAAMLEFYDAQPLPAKPHDTLPVRGMLAAWEGRFDEAARAYTVERDTFYLQEDRMLAKSYCALFSAACGERAQALAYIKEVVAESEARRSPRKSLDRARDVTRSLCCLAMALAGRRNVAERDLRLPHILETPVTSALRSAVSTIVRDAASVHASDLRAPFAILREHGHGGFVRTLEAVVRLGEGAAKAVSLTPAELAVLRALGQGQKPKEIAQSIGCTIHTVRWHIRQAVEKFGCSGQEQALRAARARGLI
jgi:ATP/maltotriose-dependent transcriptional regulator MalT